MAQLSTDLLSPGYMAKVRYVCEEAGIEYYHSKILGAIKSLAAISELGDLSLMATKLQCSVSELNENPQKLYNSFNDFKTKTDVAAWLSHLEGIKHLYGANNTVPFYEKTFDTIEERLLSIVKCKDVNAFQKVWPIYVHADKYLNTFLNIAYQHESFEIATELIKYGAKFNAKYLTTAQLGTHYSEYIKHINILKFEGLINDDILSTSKALVNAMFCGTFFISQDTTDEIYMLLHSEDSSFKKIVSIHYNEVTRPIFGLTLAIHYPHFLLLSSKSAISPFCAPLNHYFKMYGGNTEDKYFLHKFIHELTHAFLYAVFQNDSKPYPKHYLGGTSIEYEAYKKSKTLFLENILRELKVKKEEIDYSVELENVLASNMYLNLYGYCFMKGSEQSILTIVLKEYALNNWSIQNLFDTDVLDDFIKKVGELDTLRILIDIEKSIKKDHLTVSYATAFLEAVMSRLNINTEDSEAIIIQYSKIKNELKKEIEGFCSKQTFDPEYAMFFGRIFDYSKREGAMWDSELLPRFAEAYLSQNVNKKVKQLYEPLLKYWTEYVMPKADKIMEADYAYSPNIFLEKKEGWFSYIYNTISKYVSDYEELSQNIGDISEGLQKIIE